MPIPPPASRPTAQRDGARAEQLAAEYLTKQGLHLLARNVRCRGGEIDLIAQDHGTIVFVEVRLRTNPRFGTAADSITVRKRQRIILAARWWLCGAGARYASQPCRFDCVLFDRTADDARPDWLRDAFSAG